MSLLTPVARAALRVPIVYRTFGWLIGGVPGRDMLARDHIRVRPGDRVLDIGCGPADILPHLDGVDYTGFDANPNYIETATQRYGSRGRFYCKRVSEEALSTEEKFDRVLAIGVVHHLDDDEAEHLFKLAHTALAPGGKLVTLDPVIVDGYSRISAFLIARDRGQHVRREEQYRALASRVFPKVKATMRPDLLRVPYTNLVLECEP